MSFLTTTLTDAHVIVPATLSGPNANGNNLEQFFSAGQVAMWEAGDWNTVSVKTSVTFPVGVATLPVGPVGRVSVFNGLIDSLNSHTSYPKQAWELEQWLGSAQSQAILGSGGYVWPAIRSLDPLFLLPAEAGRQHVGVPDRSARPGGQLPVQPRCRRRADRGGDRPRPAWLGTEPVSAALKTAQGDADYVLKTG